MELTYEEEFIYKWQYRMLGNFKTALIHAITLADEKNLHKLSLGFPLEVQGFKQYAYEPGWWGRVKDKVAKLKGGSHED